MAFVETNLSSLAVGTGNSVGFTLWVYSTDDADTTVDDSGYFASVGSTSGSGALHEGDLMIVRCDMAGTPDIKLGVVVDAAGGQIDFMTAGGADVLLAY